MAILKPDICVIGAGSGGLTVAAAAAAFGVPVVLIERGEMGGDCLNYGCVPSKSLIAAAEHAQRLREGARFGIAAAVPDVDFGKVMQHVRGVIAAIAPHDSAERFTALGVTVLRAHASFRDRRTVIAGSHEIRARRFVIATGSSPAVPAIPGIEQVPFLTNETVFAQESLPAHLVVIGGGPVGLELAQAHRRLGSAVTVIEAGQALAREDPELATAVLDRLRSEGVEILENAGVTQVQRADGAVHVRVQEAGRVRIVEGSHLLLATGRRPDVEELALERAGIAHDAGRIRLSAGLRTSNRRVYAIGDAAGGPQFTHLANHHAGLVIRAILFRIPARENPDIVPRVTFTDPELGQVGLTEAQARERGEHVRILRWSLAENDRAQTERRTDGFIKLVTGRRGRIIGVSAVGRGAGEMMNFWALVLSQRLRLRDVAGYVSPYPTRGEIGKRAAITYFAEAARSRATRGLLRFLRLFG